MERINSEFMEKCSEEKEKYFTNIVSDLKTSNPSKWYSKLKRMTGQKQSESEINVSELDGIYDKLQAEIIADHYAVIINQY